MVMIDLTAAKSKSSGQLSKSSSRPPNLLAPILSTKNSTSVFTRHHPQRFISLNKDISIKLTAAPGGFHTYGYSFANELMKEKD